MTDTAFTEDQIQRYARHIVLPQVGSTGQQQLLSASVLVVGAGGLGSPLVLYLAAAGVGRIGIVDDDLVDLSNLQRQIAHGMDNLGVPKAASAAAAAQRINPTVRVEPHERRFGPANAAELVADYDVIADGSDNFATRFLVNDACVFAAKPLVSAALLRFEAQVATLEGVRRRAPLLPVSLSRTPARRDGADLRPGRGVRGARRPGRIDAGDRGDQGNPGNWYRACGMADHH